MKNPSPGTLLIAEPFLRDPNFARTVVFICDHQQEGSFGFVLNRRYHLTLDELMHNIGDIRIPVYFGGPVQMDTIHFLHQHPDLIPGGYEVTPGIFWGGDFELAVSLLQQGQIDGSYIRFYLGYSGWSGGQLDEEIRRHSWLTVQASRKLVFHRNAEQLWKDAVLELGGDYRIMVNFPTDPQLN